MALTHDEIDVVYSTLIELAIANDLGWVVEQIESQIALGRIRTGKIRTKAAPLRGMLDIETEQMPMGRPAMFTLSDEYSQQERLQILIQGLENAVCGVWETAHAVYNFFKENTPNLSVVSFEREGTEEGAFRLEDRTLDEKRRAVLHFQALIVELKETI
ncbi:MAG: hypothetical protein IH600_15995 [Bacteroidetes bacterium]|nr:hypothetical protein [Bacteroidota bacterium]